MKKLSAEELASLSGEDVSAIRRLHRLGLLGTEGATERFTEEDAMRLRLIRQYLDEGLPLRALVDAAQGGRLPTAYIERFFPPVAAKKYSLTEAGDRAGVEAGFAETVLRAIGLAPSEGEQLLSDDDVQALILVKRLMDSGLPDQALVEIAHVVGDTLARLAETEAQLLHAHTHEQMAASGVPELEIARDLKGLPHSLLPAIQPLIEHVHRRYLEQAARDDAATHLEAAAGLLCKGQSPGQTKVALAFADLASFTPLAEVHGDEVAGHVLERYSEMVRETARRFQGQVVKQIGDAFMIAFAEPTAAVRWAASLDELVRLEPQVDIDDAQVLVQNRVTLAEPNLPEEVKRQGVNTKKKSTNIILFISLLSPDGRYDELFLSNYATLRIKDVLARIPGVGEVVIFPPSDYSMRIWLDPRQLKSRRLTTQDVVDAVREQNVQVAAGQIGQPPAPSGQSFQYAVNVLGRLSDIEQFEQIIVKTGEGGRITRLKDIARVDLGSKTYDITSAISGAPSASIGVYQLPGANALDVANQVRAALDDLSGFFPEGMEYRIPYDTTIFVSESIKEVFVTLFQAAALVFAVLFIFLQDWRATLIPAVAIPVSLIGTFAVMGMFGFSLNMLTLFGLVLAIGVVVDDAIVVVEATATHIGKGLSAKQAAIKAMSEVSGPVVATTLVLLAVFVPTAFLPGITGEMYRQFALTIAVATVFSSINALTMSPALSALVLRPPKKRKNAFFRGFDSLFTKFEGGYMGITKALVRRTAIVMLLFVGLLGITGWQFGKVPTGFLPIEDQGYVLAAIQLPDAASLERTQQVLKRIDGILKETPGVRDWVTLGGFSIIDGTNASNAATVFITFDPWDERTDPSLSQRAILGHLMAEFRDIQEAIVFAFPPPAIPGLGVAGGFQMQLQDRGGVGLQELEQMTREIIADGRAQSGLTNLNTTFRANVPQLFAEVDRTKAKKLGVSLNEVFGTLQTYLGSVYVNDFNKFGRTWQVKAQADHQFRLEPEDIRRLDVRDAQGRMVPIGTL
ncbi:MAG: efflux RND transporter permease subunit, partial [Chloroflexi bacterium]|nr:efflux RND transporter permease subunit [Chloroflexota bacterium]